MNLLFIVIMLGIANFFAPVSDPDATAIIKKADEKVRGENSEGEIIMTIVRPEWSREMGMHSWSKGDDYSLIMVTSPARDKGITYLKREQELWNWQPSIDRVIKLPPSMMMQSWMGSDFTNDDLVKESSSVKDYDHQLMEDTIIQDYECFKIEMIPHEDAAVVWGKVITYISKKEYLQLRTVFYDEDGFLVSTMTAHDIKDLGGRLLPARMEMIPADKPGNKTIIEYKWLSFDKSFDADFFSIQNMKRVK